MPRKFDRASFAGTLRPIRRSLLDLLFPPRCAHCGVDLTRRPAIMLCTACHAELSLASSPDCRRCGSTLPSDESGEINGQLECRRCRDESFAFSAVVRLGKYADHLRMAVLHTKSGHQETLTGVLTELLWRRCGSALRELKPDVVVPVPMFWRRRVIRGANGPEVIAARLAQRLEVPAVRMLARGRHTQPQAGLSPAARRENVRGAFRMRRGFDCRDASVLLVDDVLTTGATCHEAARALRKQGGARQVAVAVLARTENV